MVQIRLHIGDLPEGLPLGKIIAVDTETLGLRIGRDPLYLVQLCGEHKPKEVPVVHIVQIDRSTCHAPNLKALLEDETIIKCFHFARFDMAVLLNDLGIEVENVYCTKIASKIARTYTDRHGLRDLRKDLLGLDISKQQQCSDWGSRQLTDAQLSYAANDVIHLHQLKEKLDHILQREGRMLLAKQCFSFLPVRVKLDLMGWENEDIFLH